MLFKRALLAALAACAFVGLPAIAQTTPPGGNPTITSGVVWTSAQWNTAWSAKQDFPATTAITLFSWTTSTRPSSPSVGAFGYNTSIGGVEVWNGSAWVSGSGTGGTVSAGTIGQIGVYAASGTTISGISLLPGSAGGTGVNNGSKLVTLGGNLTTSGAFPLTLTLTGSTSLTLPTTGTVLAGTASGNTTTFATATGTLTNGHCVSIDGSGNFIDAGGACTTGGAGGTVSAATIHQMAIYTGTTTVGGLSNVNSGVLVTSSSGIPSISTQISTTPAITVSGSLVPANIGLSVVGTQSGTSSTPGYGDATAPMLYVKDTETVTSTTVSSVLDGLNVTHVFGTGEGNRNGINSVLVNTAPTAGATSDGVEFYTSIFGSTFIQSGDGGTSGTPKGDFYGFGGLLTNAGAGTFLHGMIGAEFDVSINSGGSTAEKVGLQLITVNGDAVKGSSVDAALIISGDNTTTAGYDYGIAFGKPGFHWDVSGTLIGTYTTTNSMSAVNGVDVSSVTFSGCSFKSNGFCVNQNGVGEFAFLQSSTMAFLGTATPSTPPSGQYVMWLDTSTGHLNGKDSSGTTTQFVPASTVNSGLAGFFTLYTSSGTAVSASSNLLSGGATVSTGGWSTAAALEGKATSSVWGLSAYNSGTSGSGAFMARIDNTGQAIEQFFFGGATSVGEITYNGTNTVYGTTSDVRKKKDIVALGNAGAVIDALKPSTWKWKDTGVVGTGFVAQELYKVIPDAVGKGDDDLSLNEGDPGFKAWSRDDSKIVPYIVADEQEVHAEIRDLTARLAALEKADRQK